MKCLSPLLSATFLSSVTLSFAHVHRNFTASESFTNDSSPRYLKGKKKHNANSDNEEVWTELVQASATFEASFAEHYNKQYRAADGCLSTNEKQADICLSDNSSNIAVHCCKGSIGANNLFCSRDGCAKRSTFDAAKDYCEKKGMRLCSLPELESGACCNKGCGWNSQISWTSDSCVTTDTPTQNPTKNPTNKPATSTGTLVSISGDRNAADTQSTVGLMFEVLAREDVGITSISTFLGSNAETWTELWTRDGSYEGKTKENSGWKRIHFGKSQQGGAIASTEITLQTPIYIKKGATASFYVVSPGKIRSLQSNVKDGRAIVQNDSIALFAGTALDYDRWENGCTGGRQCVFTKRAFDGTISYNADLTITDEPTGQPTPDPFKKQASGLTLREEQWLDEHNVRRKKWHEMYGKNYKPLQWSEGLKDMAQEYADELASDCGATVHDTNRRGYGENLASNTGFDTGHGSWGELKSVDSVMTRYVERESTWAPPDNWHFMQALWYATTHVGCADSKGTMPSGAVCRYQVCRYATPGNCNVNSFNDGSKEWWMKAIMNDSSNCQPFCPPEGC